MPPFATPPRPSRLLAVLAAAAVTGCFTRDAVRDPVESPPSSGASGSGEAAPATGDARSDPAPDESAPASLPAPQAAAGERSRAAAAPAPVEESAEAYALDEVGSETEKGDAHAGGSGAGYGKVSGFEPQVLGGASAPRRSRSSSRGAGGGGGVMHRPAPPAQDFDAEAYAHVAESGFRAVADDPLSTFSVDVDTASYSNVRRFLNEGRLPPADAVRVEELLNYFRYDYPNPPAGQPFAAVTEVSACPWNPENRLVHLGLQGKRLPAADLPPRNLVFLVDVSGSMQSPDKLPLVKAGLALLVEQLTERDRIALVVYAGSSGLVLPPTPGHRKPEVLEALVRLEAGGSTAGGAGIELAYRVATENFRDGAINRVILATDGDFNVGVTSHGELVRLIERKRESGVFLTVLGFGTGNLKDATMEQLADKGNGHYAYVDSLDEARKALGAEAGAALVTIAKDVKVQVEWNPGAVAAYRLVGYENRALRAEDFNDDRKDAGEIGAGHSVTALYEVVPAGRASAHADPRVDPLRYQTGRAPSDAAASGEMLTVKLRYKEPAGQDSRLLSFPVHDRGRPLASTSADFRFSAAVAAFGMLLRDSPHRGAATFDQVWSAARDALGDDPDGYRREFLRLVEAARGLKGVEAAQVGVIAR